MTKQNYIKEIAKHVRPRAWLEFRDFLYTKNNLELSIILNNYDNTNTYTRTRYKVRRRSKN